MKVKILLIIFCSLLSPAFGDELFQYSIGSYPKNPALGCALTAQDIGKQFSAVTGKKVFRATCDAENRFGYDMTITYVAQASEPQMSTRQEAGGFGGRLGVYRSREECESNLSQEIRWFEESTGLTRFLAYCYLESDLNLTPYAAYVTGFGVAKLHPYRFEATVYGNVFSSPDWARELSEIALRAGIQVKQVTIAHDGSNKLVVRYYDSPENILFHSGYFVLPPSGPFPHMKTGNEVAQFYSYQPKETQEACLFSGEKILKTFAPEFTDKSIWFCVWDPMLFKAALYVVRVKPTISTEGENAPLYYGSFGKCEAERKDVLELYKSELKKDVLGGVCTWQSQFGTGKPDGYFARIFTRTKE